MYRACDGGRIQFARHSSHLYFTDTHTDTRTRRQRETDRHTERRTAGRPIHMIDDCSFRASAWPGHTSAAKETAGHDNYQRRSILSATEYENEMQLPAVHFLF